MEVSSLHCSKTTEVFPSCAYYDALPLLGKKKFFNGLAHCYQTYILSLFFVVYQIMLLTQGLCTCCFLCQAYPFSFSPCHLAESPSSLSLGIRNQLLRKLSAVGIFCLTYMTFISSGSENGISVFLWGTTPSQLLSMGFR